MSLLLALAPAALLLITLARIAWKSRLPRRRTCRDGSCAVCRPWARFFGGRDE